MCQKIMPTAEGFRFKTMTGVEKSHRVRCRILAPRCLISPRSQRRGCLLRINREPRGLFVGFAHVFPPSSQTARWRKRSKAAHLGGASAACCCLARLMPAEARPLGDTRPQSIEGQGGGSTGFEWLGRVAASSRESPSLPGSGWSTFPLNI